MKLILALAVGVIVSGCSSVPAQVREPQRAENDSLLACDYAKMQTIDRAAQAAGGLRRVGPLPDAQTRSHLVRTEV